MQDPQAVGTGAKCAIHPERTATRTCSRCGNFTCDECNALGRESLCPACRALTGGETFPFTRDNFSFDAIWNYSFERWKQEWVMLSVCVLIFFAASTIASIFSSVFQSIGQAIIGQRFGTAGIIYVTVIATVASQAIAIVAQGPFQMGIIRILIDVLNGKKADIGRILTQLPKLGRYIVQMILVQLMVIVPLALYVLTLMVIALVISGTELTDVGHWDRAFRGAGIAVLVVGLLVIFPFIFYVTLPLTFANMELVYGDASPVESIRRSFQIANGFRTTIFGFAFIGGLVALVGFLACCIGILPAYALTYMLLVGLYLALRNGSGLPAPVES